MYLGYIRVSRVGEREERLISPELQAGRIESYAASRGLEVEMLEPELDVSGAKVDRPILNQALAQLEAGQAQGLIVAQLDRLSRLTLIDALKVIERIESAGAEVIAVAENIDTSTPAGRMSRNLLLSIGNFQWEGYRDQFAAAKIRAVGQGIWPFPVVPMGYRKRADRRLTPSRDAPKVRHAFELRASARPWSVIADLLGKGHSGAGKVIRNRVYLGEIAIDKLGVRNRSAHEPLVSRGLWEAAQLSHPRPPRSGTAALLQGIVRCAGCSHTMTPGLDKGRRLYRCFARNVAGRCKSPAIISAAILEPVVEATFLAHVDVVAEGKPQTDTLAEAQRTLDAAEAELEAFQRETKVSGVDATHFASGLRERAEAVEDARRSLGQARATQSPQASLRRLSVEWPGLSVEQRRHVLRSSLGVVWVRKGTGANRIKVIAAGFEPPDLSGPGRSSPIRRIDWTTLPGELGLVSP